MSISAFGGQSQIHAVGETALSPDATKSIITNILRNVGIGAGLISFDQKTIAQQQAGDTLKPPVYTTSGGKKPPTNIVNVPALGNFDLSNFSLPDIPTGNFLSSLGMSLGVTTPIVIAGLVILGVIVLKK